MKNSWTLIDIIVVNFGQTRQHNHVKKGSQKRESTLWWGYMDATLTIFLIYLKTTRIYIYIYIYIYKLSNKKIHLCKDNTSSLLKIQNHIKIMDSQ